jgi:hypothetical protein
MLTKRDMKKTNNQYIKWAYFQDQIVIEGEPGIFKKSHNLTEIYDLRPGTWLKLKGEDRNSEGYDSIIINAYKISNSGRFNESWNFDCLLVDSIDDNNKYVYKTINFNDISYPIEPSFQITELPSPNKEVLKKQVSTFANIDNEILRLINKYPNLIEQLNADDFEKLVQKIYIKFGFDVQRIGRWNQADGGIDLLATKKYIPNMGEFRLVIQCKHSTNSVSSTPIRELNGVIDKFKADRGVVAVSSKFTKYAINEARNSFWRIDLEDRNSIIKKLKIFFE